MKGKDFKKVKELKSKDAGFTVRQFYIDDNNLLEIKSNDRLIHVKLKLKGDKKRFIGTITKSTRTFVTTRKRDVHLQNSNNSYAFNNYFLENAYTFDMIRLSDDMGNHWKIPLAYMLEHGTFLHFKVQGFEKQRFVSLEKLEQFRVRNEENRRF